MSSGFLEQSPGRDVVQGRMYQDVGHALRYEVRVNGTKLGRDVAGLIISLEVAMSVDGADAVSITLQGGLRAEGATDVTDSYIFAEGNKLEVLAGYENEPLVHMGLFHLQVPRVRGGPEGRSLEAFGLSGAHRLLNNKQPWRFGKNINDEQVIQELASLADLDVEIEGPILPRTKQRLKDAGKTDFEFLDVIAVEARNSKGLDFRWYVRHDENAGRDVLVFEPFRIDVQDEQYVFRFEDQATAMSSLYEWEIDPGLKGMPTKVSLVYMNREAREEREVVANLADPTSDPEVLWSGKVGGLKGIDKAVKDGAALRLRTGDDATDLNPRREPGVPPRLEFDNEAEAQHFVRQWFRERQFAFATGKFTTVGMPRVRPWHVHWFKGMSKRWDGQYVITEVNHQFGRGSPYALDIAGNRLVDQSLQPSTEVR